MSEERKLELQENAFRELKKGETFTPIVWQENPGPQASKRSIFWGLFIMLPIFTVASALIAGKLSQGIEVAIPITTLAVGLSIVYKKFGSRSNTLLENVIIQSIGQSAGIVAGGIAFAVPAFYIMGIEVNILNAIIGGFLGGCLGILYLIPFRRYFVEEQHGKLPFPEATAITKTLVAGEAGGKAARILAISFVIGGIYDFLIYGFGVWKETFETKFLPLFDRVSGSIKANFTFNTTAMAAGMGYIIGWKFAVTIFIGSVFSTLILVPLLAIFGSGYTPNDLGLGYLFEATGKAKHLKLIEVVFGDPSFEPRFIFGVIVKHIGIGAIIAAALLGIYRLRSVIAKSLSLAVKEFRRVKKGEAEEGSPRIDRDIRMTTVVILWAVVMLGLLVFFRFAILADSNYPWITSFVAAIVVAASAYLFTMVSAYAIATVGVTPVSGMTLVALLISGFVFSAFGLSGDAGKIAALTVGVALCTSLSMTGSLVTDFKIAYWIGATPKTQQLLKFAGLLFASIIITFTIVLLNRVYGYTEGGPNPLPASQPRAMAAVLNLLFAKEAISWTLYAMYGLGVLCVLAAMKFGAIPIAFALGMYIPFELNAPILAGALIGEMVKKYARSRGDDESGIEARHEKGMMVATGFMAGGALFGVVAAILRSVGGDFSVMIAKAANLYNEEKEIASIADCDWANYIALVAVLGLYVFFYYYARRKEE